MNRHPHPARPRTRPSLALVTAVLAGTALLAACGREPGEATAGEKIDQATAQVERKAEELKNDALTASREARAATSEAAGAVADKARDMKITAAVNAALVGDPALSALRIDVDTVAGRVALRGSAPDAQARDRASLLARAVDGVVAVDNALTVEPRT